MNRTRLLGILVVLLVVCNLLLCISIFRKGSPRPEHRMPKEVIIERLGFDDMQVKEYEKLIDEHREAIKKTQDEIHHLKDQLYATVASGAAARRDSLIAAIGKEQMLIEEINVNHFEDIGKLCTAGQKSKFESLTHEMSALFGPPPPPPHERKP